MKTGSYILRLVITIAIAILFFMLYWSSLLIEEDLKTLSQELGQLNLKIDALSLALSEIDQREPIAKTREKNGRLHKQERPYIDPSLPNLLTEDPFYEKTLPNLLGGRFTPHGIFHDAIIGKPNNLHPLSNWSTVAGWNGDCVGSVAALAFGKYESFAPDLAIKVEERINQNSGDPEYWVHLREAVFWHPIDPSLFSEDIRLSPHFLKKHPVTAHDFKFGFDAIMNPFVQESGALARRIYLFDLEEIRVIDDLTFVARWKTKKIIGDDGKEIKKAKYMTKQLTGSLKPLPCFVYQYFANGKKIVDDDSDPETYRKNSVWAQNFSEHWAKNIIVSCGPWIFDGMSDRQINFKRNPHYYFPLSALALRREITFKEAPENIWQDFQAGSLDYYNVQPTKLADVEEFLKSASYQDQSSKGLAIHRLEYLFRGYQYIGWNMQKPFFKSKKVRQALTMAIDRRRIVEKNLNGLGIEITGSFFYGSPSYDKSIQPWPFDPEAALTLLKEEGWIDRDGDGILDNIIEGKLTPFRFTLTYYVKNPTMKSICQYIATALGEIGVACNLNGVDLPDLSSTMDDKSFEAVAMGWALGTPPEDPRQLWYSTGAKEKGSSNTVGFVNKEADAIIDQLDYEDDPEKRIKLYHRFHAILHEELPNTFLYSSKVVMFYRDYLQNVFLPFDRQDLIPGANVAEPQPSIYWIKDD
jgi:peptide/nickel transport system substrate-binding protein